MKFIGNYRSWIQLSWLEYLDTHDGLHVPRDQQVDRLEKSPLNESGCDQKSSVFAILYDQESTPLDIINLPWTDMQYYWWIEKIMPSMLSPKHRDSVYKYKNAYRYWMPLQDYETGHIFVYKDTLMTGYKAGDLYMYADENEYHYTGNAGWNYLLHLNITTGDELV